LKIKESKLPVRYLGVPLIVQKLTIEDCGSLLDKILGWLRNFLLLGGCRLQLLSSIQVFWASIFILPKKIIKLLVQKLKGDGLGRYPEMGSTGIKEE
jgi:hypothetical protein